MGVDYVWYLRGWMVVPPHCVLESNPRRVCILEGAMTLALAHALTAYMERTENPDVVRPALYYAVGPNFAHYLKGAVQTIESDESHGPFQSPPLLCERLEGYLLPLDRHVQTQASTLRPTLSVPIACFFA